MNARLTMPHRSRRLVVAGLALALAGCGSNAAASPSPRQTPNVFTPPTQGPELALHWPAPADAMALTVEAGLVPDPKEYTNNHAHSHLDVFIDGRPILVPAGIGINIEDPGVTKFDDAAGVGYGNIQLCAQPCISPLHTHDPDGIIHTESKTPEALTLGQFFTEWAVELSGTCVGEFCSPEKPVAFYVNGAPYTGDPGAIELTDLKVIVIVIGTPPSEIPSTADFSGP